MCRFIKLLIILLVGFIGMSLWSGGDKFREIGEKAGGGLQTACDKLADQADEISEKVRGKHKKIEEWKSEKEKKSLESVNNFKELKKEGLFEK